MLFKSSFSILLLSLLLHKLLFFFFLLQNSLQLLLLLHSFGYLLELHNLCQLSSFLDLLLLLLFLFEIIFIFLDDLWIEWGLVSLGMFCFLLIQFFSDASRWWFLPLLDDWFGFLTSLWSFRGLLDGGLYLLCFGLFLALLTNLFFRYRLVYLRWNNSKFAWSCNQSLKVICLLERIDILHQRFEEAFSGLTLYCLSFWCSFLTMRSVSLLELGWLLFDLFLWFGLSLFNFLWWWFNWFSLCLYTSSQLSWTQFLWLFLDLLFWFGLDWFSNLLFLLRWLSSWSLLDWFLLFHRRKLGRWSLFHLFGASFSSSPWSFHLLNRLLFFLWTFYDRLLNLWFGFSNLFLTSCSLLWHLYFFLLRCNGWWRFLNLLVNFMYTFFLLNLFLFTFALPLWICLIKY